MGREERKRGRKLNKAKRGESVRETLQGSDKVFGHRGVRRHLCIKHEEAIMFRDVVSSYASPAAAHDVVEESIVALVAREEQKMHYMNDGIVADEWEADKDVEET